MTVAAVTCLGVLTLTLTLTLTLGQLGGEGGQGSRHILGTSGGSAPDSLVSQGSYVYVLKPSSSEADLIRMTKHLSLLSVFVKGFAVEYRWPSLNAFIVTGATPTVASLINEMDEIGLAALVDMNKLTSLQLSPTAAIYANKDKTTNMKA